MTVDHQVERARERLNVRETQRLQIEMWCHQYVDVSWSTRLTELTHIEGTGYEQGRADISVRDEQGKRNIR